MENQKQLSQEKKKAVALYKEIQMYFQGWTLVKKVFTFHYLMTSGSAWNGQFADDYRPGGLGGSC